MRARTLLGLLASLALACEGRLLGDDAGSTVDAGSDPADAGAPRDAGPVPDAGPLPDAGASPDAGTPTDAGPSPGSAGCGMASALATETWVAHTLTVDGTTRDYFVYLPPGYDPDRAYPVVYQFHGCSSGDSRQNNHPPVQNEAGADAIHVRGRAVGDCWDAGREGPDVRFFDALVVAIEGSFCADPARRFATGYSSGAFMTHRLACDRGEALRGVASIAGGQGGSTCVGRTAALLIHDTDDGTVGIAASEAARDLHATRNGCDTEAARTAVDPSPCEAYAGCDPGYPVVWCQTSGLGHSRQDGLAAPAFWDFLSSLP